jgi:hypothetical protein
VAPIDFLNRALISYALGKRQSGSFRMRRRGRLRCGLEESQQCHGQKHDHVRGASTNVSVNRRNSLFHSWQLPFTFVPRDLFQPLADQAFY